MDRRKSTKTSRRRFVQQAGLGAAGRGGARQRRAAGAAASAVPASWDLEADVVVIGAGACGLPAAIRAADTGASVLVVEANSLEEPQDMPYGDRRSMVKDPCSTIWRIATRMRFVRRLDDRASLVATRPAL
jgi:NADPH-dependent 2,4-dienoyl-CoA reductase/sulfur reductase-like enzyme